MSIRLLKGGASATDKGEEVLAVKASPKLLEALDRVASRVTPPGQKPLSLGPRSWSSCWSRL